MNRHTRSLILDDDIWDDLHSSFLQEQLASGDRLSKTDFVERVFRLGLAAVRRARTPRSSATDVPVPRVERRPEPARSVEPPQPDPAPEPPSDQPVPAQGGAGATATTPSARPAATPQQSPAQTPAEAEPRTRRRSVDRLLTMSQVGDPTQISSAADRRPRSD